MDAPIDPELLKYYEAYMTLFAYDEWALFIDDMSGSLDSNQKTAIQRCDTDKAWFEERGIQTQMLRIINFEKIMRQRYEELIEGEGTIETDSSDPDYDLADE